MQKVRIGNDLTIDWTILRQGSPEDFGHKKLTVLLVHPYQASPAVTYTIEGNVIHLVWLGKNQLHTGVYRLLLIENEGLPGMNTLDRSDALELVSSSAEVGDGGIREIHISLSSDVAFPAAGLSAYEIACQQGFVGSEDEWLQSLVGPRGERGENLYEMMVRTGLFEGTEEEFLKQQDARFSKIENQLNGVKIVLI